MRCQEIQKTLEKRLGTVREVTQITKGFSNEEKFRVTLLSGECLLRISPIRALERKKEEFELIHTSFASGVRCNRPIELFVAEEENAIYSLFSFLPGEDAEETIQALAEQTQFEIGIQAGRDLKKINSLKRDTAAWKQHKLAKHERYLKHYFEQEYRFANDRKVSKFIELNCDAIASGPDRLQHDDFHLGNIVIDNGRYSGILDFNRFDWGDPLHEFVKLEWFTWPVSREFARGQIQGYFGGQPLGPDTCLVLSVYIAMSIFSTVVWTLKFHPHTMPFIEKRMRSLLESYEYFDRIQPGWAL